MIYIASPFFNDEQLEAVRRVEIILKKNELEFFSPRLHGIDMSALSEEERKSGATAHKVFAGNVKSMEASTLMLACVDGKDQGTNFEMGFFYRHLMPFGDAGRCNNLLTWSAKGSKSNLMISQCAGGHFSTLDIMELLFKTLTSSPTMDILSRDSSKRKLGVASWDYVVNKYELERLDVDEKVV